MHPLLGIMFFVLGLILGAILTILFLNDAGVVELAKLSVDALIACQELNPDAVCTIVAVIE